jgi:pimeloyl-ACP methyl ester carboxylesterase
MLRKITKYAAIATGVGATIVALMAGICALSYRQEMRIDGASGINEGGYVKIGGIDQWIQIRGHDRNNPVILWLNGGPGFSTIPNTYLVRTWEKPFTIAMWDERGEGKTFDRSGTSVASTMTIDQMSRDGIEVAEYLRSHLHKDKIILLGHSWGSLLAVHMVHMRPDLFSAYVGTAQVVNLEKDAEAAYPLLIERAKALGNKTAEQQLVSVGPPPYPEQGSKKWVWVSWANRLDPRNPPPQPLSFDALWWAGTQTLRAPNRGANFSQGLMWTSILNDNLPSQSLHFDVPVIFIQGAEDRLTVTALAKSYFDSIDAPSKQFIVLPGVGHLAVFMGRDRFLQALVDDVRPLAVKNGG